MSASKDGEGLPRGGPIISDESAARAAMLGATNEAVSLRQRVAGISRQYGRGLDILRQQDDPRFLRLLHEVDAARAILRGEATAN